MQFYRPRQFPLPCVFTAQSTTINRPYSMKTIRNITLAVLVATATFCLPPKEATAAGNKDVVAVAAGAGSFNTLVAAVKAAGLIETLQGPGPFTVFAPTDEAFAKLPEGTLEDLLKPENKQKLVDILTYHVVAGKVMAADVKTMKAKVNGAELDIKVVRRGCDRHDAKVVKTDVAARQRRDSCHRHRRAAEVTVSLPPPRGWWA